MINHKKIGIIGAGGLTGLELISLLNKHSFVEIVYITSSQYQNQLLNKAFPALASVKTKDLKFVNHPISNTDLPTELDVVFLAVPDDVSMKLVPQFHSGVLIIDLGGAFRILNHRKFEKYYKIPHRCPDYISKFTYGLPEVYHEKITVQSYISNPGCYPTSVLLPIWILSEVLKEYKATIIIDSKSGTSGAGTRKEKDELSFSSVNNNFKAYKTDQHQHIPEIQEQITYFCPHFNLIQFTPQLLPIFRGIFSSVYISFQENVNLTSQDLVQHIKKIIHEHELFFIRFYQNPKELEIKNILKTNFLDFSIQWDQKNNLLTLYSVLDNLIKGAAGQAIQNMNIALNFNLSEGLN